MSRARELLAVLMQAQTGGFLAQTPGFDGQPGLGLVGIHGVPRARTWDAVASAHAPDATGDTATFVVLQDGTVLVEDDQPENSLLPLADAIEERLEPPYRAAAVRNEGDVWAAVAEAIAVVEIPGLEGDVVELTLVDGVRALTVDGRPTIRSLPPLDRLTAEHANVAVHAERIDEELFAADVFPL